MIKLKYYFFALFFLINIDLHVHAESTASNYPKEPIKILVGGVPGASSDTYARIIAEQLGKVLGQNVIVENKTGASGILATNTLVSAPADGYTLELIYTPHTLSPFLFNSLSYNPVKDVTAVMMLIRSPLLLAVNSNSGAKSYDDLLKQAKDHPLNYGSAGVGSGGHLSGELFRKNTTGSFTHIPYRGAAPAAAALVGGELDFAFISQITAKEFAQAGKLRLLATTGKARSTALPSVPTLQELGIKDFEFQNWFGIIAPPKTPAPIIKKLNLALREVLRQPAMIQRLTKDGSEIVANTPEQFAQFLIDDSEKWRQLVGPMGLQSP
jgi:tripartite-type tricarboxylate transporter receptor subunit TctC